MKNPYQERWAAIVRIVWTEGIDNPYGVPITAETLATIERRFPAPRQPKTLREANELYASHGRGPR